MASQRLAGEIVQRGVQGLTGGFEPVHLLFVDEFGTATGRGGDRDGRQFGSRDAGDAVDQFVRLVHHDHIVFGQHLDAADGVDGQQGVVGDDDVGLRGFGPGLLGEAILAERAARFAQAFPRGHADLPPRPIGDAGGEIVAVAGLRIGGPLVEPLHLTAEPRDRERIEQFGLGRLLPGSHC